MISLRHWTISGCTLILVGALGATLTDSFGDYILWTAFILLAVAVYLLLASIAEPDDALDGKYWPEKDVARRRVLSVLSSGFLGMSVTGFMGAIFDKLAVTEPTYFLLIPATAAIIMLLVIFWPQSQPGAAATCSECGRSN